MSPFLLIVMSVSVLYVLHQSLKVLFRAIEKAHEHLRESDRRTNGGELVRERAG